MSLGRTGGVDTLAYLLEDPFRTVRGERRLGTPFLARTAAMLDLRETPLYAVLHESIYGQDTATAWSADRLRATAGDDDGIAAGFAEDLAGTGDDPVFLTGEHFFPWHLEEDPALRPWRDVAEILARKDDWTPLYDAAALRAVDVPTAAAVYLDDMFVPTTCPPRPPSSSARTAPAAPLRDEPVGAQRHRRRRGRDPAPSPPVGARPLTGLGSTP